MALLYFKADISPDLYEYTAMMVVRAPHLARFYGTLRPGTGDARLCLVSDFAPHGSLLNFFEFAEEKGITVSTFHKLEMARQAGDGLLSLHQHDLVHADVAARNVLVYRFDVSDHHNVLVKLCDYGLVRPKSQYTDITGKFAANGEPRLLAPKWAAWESLKKDKFYRASDVWSFGVMLWEALTECDEPYVDVPSTPSAMITHLSEGHRLARPKNCDDALWELMCHCWHEKRTDRPDLEEVLRKITQNLHAQAVAAATAAAAAEAKEAKASLAALKAAQEAWTLPGFGWRRGNIALTPALDADVQYTVTAGPPSADLLASTVGPNAERVADAIEDMVTRAGGPRGDRYRTAVVTNVLLSKNHDLIASFNKRLQRLCMQRQTNQNSPLFNGCWGDGLSGTDLTEKETVYARLEKHFASTEVGAGPGAKVVLMWHGVPNEDVADAILATGLSSRVSGDDQGYFGKGVYLTFESACAGYYANRQRRPQTGQRLTLLLCAVCLANPYPVTRSVDYVGNLNISKFHYNFGEPGTAKALKGGFDAHFAAVRMSEEWQAASNVAEADFHELVVSDEQQVLPFAKVTFTVR